MSWCQSSTDISPRRLPTTRLLACAERIDAARMKWIHEIKRDYQGWEAPVSEFYSALVSGGPRQADCEPSGTCGHCGRHARLFSL
jgi:hypothetical protein